MILNKKFISHDIIPRIHINDQITIFIDAPGNVYGALSTGLLQGFYKVFFVEFKLGMIAIIYNEVKASALSFQYKKSPMSEFSGLTITVMTRPDLVTTKLTRNEI